jgi:hypothetical protein
MSAEVRVTGRPAAVEVASKPALRLDVHTVSGGAGGGGYSPPLWAEATRYCNLLITVPANYNVLGTPSLVTEGYVAYYQPAGVDPNTYPQWTSGSVSGFYAGHSDGTTPAVPTFLGTPPGGTFFYNHIQVDANDSNNPVVTTDDILFYVPSAGGGPNRVVQAKLGNTAAATTVDAAGFTGNLAGLDPTNVQQALAVFDAYAGGGGGGSGTVTGVTGVAPISVTASSTSPEVSIVAASTSVAGSMSASDKTKLNGIASGATANSSDAYLLDRTHHTGTQSVTTITGLAAVATTGAYADLTGKPTLAAVATTGAYADLTGKPTLAAVATTGAYADLAGKPTLAAVATTGSASDLTTGTLPSARLALTATDIPTLTLAKISDAGTLAGKSTIANADVSTTAAIAASKISGLAAVATTGAYADLSGKPTLAAVATTGAYSDLTGRPSLAAVATSGSASDLTTGTVASARLSTKAVGGQGAGSQVNEPSTATSLLTSTVTLPACAAGDVLIVDAGINFTQNSAASRNITFAVKIGTTTILTTTPSVSASATGRQAHLHAVIRVLTTTSQSGEMTLVFNTTTAGSTGVASAATGTATETISSGTLALDVLVTATSNTTQNYTLTSLSVNKVAA